MSKFDEILLSSDACDALLGEQIDKLSERIEAIETNMNAAALMNEGDTHDS